MLSVKSYLLPQLRMLRHVITYSWHVFGGAVAEAESSDLGIIFRLNWLVFAFCGRFGEDTLAERLTGTFHDPLWFLPMAWCVGWLESHLHHGTACWRCGCYCTWGLPSGVSSVGPGMSHYRRTCGRGAPHRYFQTEWLSFTFHPCHFLHTGTINTTRGGARRRGVPEGRSNHWQSSMWWVSGSGRPVRSSTWRLSSNQAQRSTHCSPEWRTPSPRRNWQVWSTRSPASVVRCTLGKHKGA